MKHDWKRISRMEDKSAHGFHPLDQVRTCVNCDTYQRLETLYDFGSYSIRGGPKVRGYRWEPLAGRCGS